MVRGERLVGRADVKAAVIDALAQAQSGTGQLLLISGEAGIGKSAVLSFLAGAVDDGTRVLRGFCLPGSGVPPYWPWIQVLRASGMPATDLGAAGRLFEPAGGPPDPDGALAAADARFRLHDGIGRALADLAADQPVVVVLDDLHWADEQSLAVLDQVIRGLAGDRVLIVGAYRDAEAGAALLGLAAGHHLPLAGLSLTEARALVAALPGSSPSPDVIEQVWRRSDGNPFFIRELVRLVQAQGGGHLPGHLPAGVIETVRRRMARLPSESARLLDWAAVAGRDIDVHLLIAAGAVAGESTAMDLLMPARRAGIVTDDPPRFSHDLFRDAILDGQAAPTWATINLAIARSLQRFSPADPARIAAHLMSAGPQARTDATRYCILAARAATAALGHHDACRHYLQALPRLAIGDPRYVETLLELAAAHDRDGSADLARARYRQAAEHTLAADDTVALARAALGLHSLGQRSQASVDEVVGLLRVADDRLEATPGRRGLHARVVAALTRALRHGSDPLPPADLLHIADRAVTLGRLSGDAAALATALLARHDALWQPGSAAARLPVVDEMLVAANDAGDRELVALAHLLRATALLELGDPVGRDELLRYVTLSEQLGNARGQWAALTRRATYAQIAGRTAEAVVLSAEAVELGRAIGEPDAVGCWGTLRLALVALGAPGAPVTLDRADPMWPMFPLLRAWAPAVAGDLTAARDALGDFSVLDLTMWLGLEALAVGAVVFAAVGTEAQRRWTYEHLLPFAGTHVVVGGCASYHAAVDHHLGVLAASLGERTAATTHLKAAVTMHHRLGAAGWERVSQRELDRIAAAEQPPANEFRIIDGQWRLRFGGRTAHLPDAKGLHDLAALITAQGADVHVRDLLDQAAATAVAGTGADPVLDERARAKYRDRLDALAEQIEDAELLGQLDKAARLAGERSAVIRELAAASGFGGRNRRLGDEAERARKAVGARVRDSLRRIERVHPALATHLRAALRMGIVCSYRPAIAMAWRLGPTRLRDAASRAASVPRTGQDGDRWRHEQPDAGQSRGSLPP